LGQCVRVNRGTSFGSQPDLFGLGDAHPYFDELDGSGAAAIVFEGEVQEGRGAGALADELALIRRDILQVIERFKPDGCERGDRWYRVRIIDFWCGGQRGHVLDHPFHAFPSGVFGGDLILEILGLKQIEQSVQAGLFGGSGLSVAGHEHGETRQGNGEVKANPGVHVE